MLRGEYLINEVEQEDNWGCWQWLGAHSNGRPTVHYKGRTRYAYSAAYEERFGPVPVGMELDHTCYNKWCWNPNHVQPVTHAQNLQRGNGLPHHNSIKTHCPHGHEYTKENTYDRVNGRWCKACQRNRNEAMRVRKLA